MQRPDGGNWVFGDPPFIYMEWKWQCEWYNADIFDHLSLLKILWWAFSQSKRIWSIDQRSFLSQNLHPSSPQHGNKTSHARFWAPFLNDWLHIVPKAMAMAICLLAFWGWVLKILSQQDTKGLHRCRCWYLVADLFMNFMNIIDPPPFILTVIKILFI